MNQDGFKPNLETHLLPLLSIKSEDTSSESKDKNGALSSKSYHHSLLMQVAIVFAYFKLNVKYCQKFEHTPCSWIQTTALHLNVLYCNDQTTENPG